MSLPPYVAGWVLNAEGGVADVRGDPGGRTVAGITAGTAARYGITPVDNLTVIQWFDIYDKEYWTRVRAPELGKRLALAVFDSAVNTGPPHAISLLQQTVGTPADGKFGPATMRAIETAVARQGAVRVENAFLNGCNSFYEELVDRFPPLAIFLPGWKARVRHLREYLDFVSALLTVTT